MQRKTVVILLLLSLFVGIQAQNSLDVQGKAKIAVMDKNNSADSVVVRLSDGTLAVRDVSTIAGTGGSPGYLGKDTLGGILFYIYKGSDGMDHGLIVDTIESSAEWQTASAFVMAQRSWDGPYNTDRMDDAGTSPAKDWVDGRSAVLPGDWYLPSIDELNLLWENRFHVNKALFDGGHTLLNLTETYWSSTEFGPSTAIYFNPNLGTIFNQDKTDTRRVRAVRAF